MHLRVRPVDSLRTWQQSLKCRCLWVTVASVGFDGIVAFEEFASTIKTKNDQQLDGDQWSCFAILVGI